MYPVSAGKGGIKVKPDLMERERLYHVVLEDKVFLIFKDSQDVLNCYEVDEKELVEGARALSDGDVGPLLEEYIKRNVPARGR